MKFRAWIETKEQRPITTGDGLIVPQKGDLVLVAIIERWDDADEAIKALKKLTGGSEP